MPSPFRIRKNISKFFAWLEPIVRHVCDHPEHMQRLSIIGSGIIMWPTVIGFALIVWKGYGEAQADQSLNFMGMALIGSMLLWGLVVVALLGIVKGLRLGGPAGMSVEITTTADDPDVDPSTSRPSVSFQDGRGGGGFGGGRGQDNRNGRPMPQVNITQVAGDIAPPVEPVPDTLNKPSQGEVSD